jgi:hypothetical protein
MTFALALKQLHAVGEICEFDSDLEICPIIRRYY